MIIAVNPERTAQVISAEDAVLANLEWYRQHDEASEQQWSDVLGILRVQGEQLDRDYLRSTADELNVTDLLDKALAATG
jgi:hypothetical protein